MALSVRLRTAVAEDAAKLAAIEQESFPDPSWTAPDFMKYDCVVAEVEKEGCKKAIGGFLVSRETFHGTRSTPPEREILNLAVAVEFRRLGIASHLLNHEIGRRSTLFLEVRKSNTTAIHLYAKAGFTEISRRTDYYDNPVESAIVMRMKW